MLDLERFFSRSPFLYHVANDGAWPLIRDHGLLSTRRLITLSAITRENLDALIVNRQKNCVPLAVPSIGQVVLLDQGTLNKAKLRSVLEPSLSIKDWIDLLDCRVFLWAKRESLQGLIGARNYRNRVQTIVQIDTRSLFDAYRDAIEIADINTGSVIHKPAKRGRFTFQKVANYERYKRREIVEVTVPEGIPDITRYVCRVTRSRANGEETVLYAI